MANTKPSYDELDTMFKAACELADRYRRERDGARAENAAVKSKLTDAVVERGSVREAIQKSLEHPASSSGRMSGGAGSWAPNTKATLPPKDRLNP